MTRKYKHVQEYEKEILTLREEGLTHREIGEQLGFSLQEVRKFLERYRGKQRKIEAGQAIHKKGRPCKNDNELPPSIQRLDKLSQMKYVMASKDRYIKRLEMENELLRDFLSRTERK
ncbi:MAG: imidazolonepropionase [Eubacterium sp.]|nr:imidazolonepropionase [Eubacterium sp.]